MKLEKVPADPHGICFFKLTFLTFHSYPAKGCVSVNEKTPPLLQQLILCRKNLHQTLLKLLFKTHNIKFIYFYMFCHKTANLGAASFCIPPGRRLLVCKTFYFNIRPYGKNGKNQKGNHCDQGKHDLLH